MHHRGNAPKREGGNGDPVERLKRFPAFQKFALFGGKGNRRSVEGRLDVHFRSRWKSSIEFDGEEGLVQRTEH